MKDSEVSDAAARSGPQGTHAEELSPEELLAHLDADTLDPAAFHHEHHVATAWAALREPRAESRICRGLRSLAERAHVPERYDQELTLRFLHLIEDRLRRAQDASWPEFRARFPELFDRQRAQACMRELRPPAEEGQRKRRR
ncbi:MAG TPA: hypothetical protein VGH20_13310 [Myxococcales bacterium]|jgi:hypothetical protein